MIMVLVLARQQKTHDLVRRNAHQDHAQLTQTLNYDRAFRARANQAGALVWVICRYIPPNTCPKLLRAWRGPHNVFCVLQEVPVVALDTSQNVNFQR